MTYIRTLPTLLVSLLLGAGVLLQTAVPGFTSPAESTLDRLLEPVIITNIEAFNGAPVDEICAYRHNGTDWEQIPFQIDEKNASGDYVTQEDGIVDANDEMVFMSADLGGISPTPITDLPNVAEPAYRVEVTNPLNPSAKGWAYLIKLTEGACTSDRDYADYDAGTLNLSTENYTVGWAETYSSFDRFTLFGSDNILDRTKLFVRWGMILTANEETPLLLQPVELIKDGAVRVIVKRGASLNFGYASLLANTTPVPLNALPPQGAAINEVRVSFDLLPDVEGTYYNENVPDGVAIDGDPDSVPTDLIKAWRQISLTDEAVDATIVEVADLGTISGTRQHYYKDESDCDANDTGDQQCWGDSGFALISPAKEAFTVTGTRYMLPGAQANIGDTYYDYVANPLTITIKEEESSVTETIYLPQIIQ